MNVLYHIHSFSFQSCDIFLVIVSFTKTDLKLLESLQKKNCNCFFLNTTDHFPDVSVLFKV